MATLGKRSVSAGGAGIPDLATGAGTGHHVRGNDGSSDYRTYNEGRTESDKESFRENEVKAPRGTVGQVFLCVACGIVFGIAMEKGRSKCPTPS